MCSSDLEPSTSEMRTRIFIGGVCGNLGFYEKVVLPLIGENIELLLGPSKLSGVKPSSEPDVKDKHHYVEESLQDFLDKHYHFEEPLQFGKYKGKSIKQIIDIDLSYIVWSIRKGIINTTSEAMSYLYSVLYSYHGVDKFLPQMDLLKSSRISSLDEMFDLEKSIYDEGSKDCDDNTDYFDSNMLDDALEGDPDNYWNID